MVVRIGVLSQRPRQVRHVQEKIIARCGGVATTNIEDDISTEMRTTFAPPAEVTSLSAVSTLHASATDDFASSSRSYCATCNNPLTQCLPVTATSEVVIDLHLDADESRQPRSYDYTPSRLSPTQQVDELPHIAPRNVSTSTLSTPPPIQLMTSPVTKARPTIHTSRPMHFCFLHDIYEKPSVASITTPSL